MNIDELYTSTPLSRHAEIAVADGRVYYDDEEYRMESDGELRLLRSGKKQREEMAALKADLAAIKAKLGVG